VFFWGTAATGTFVDVRVTQALDYDLWGEVVEAPADDARSENGT
jgi:ribosomal protein S12 methylthiotransferase